MAKIKIIRVPFFYTLITVLSLFPACQNFNAGSRNQKLSNVNDEAFSQSNSTIKYAKWFNIEKKGDVSIVKIFEPGNGRKARETYYVLNDRRSVLDSIEPKFQFHSPLDSIAVFSATQLNALDKLGLLDKVIGVSEAAYIQNGHVRERYRQGLVAELAGNGSFYVEKALQVNPSVIFYSPYNTNESHPLASTKIPMVSYLDFMEESPLGRAEWIKFTAVFFGKEKLADSLFDLVEEQYNGYKEIALLAKEKPTIFSDKYFNGQWFVPGGQSYVAMLFADANADYVWKDTPQSGSFPLDFEVVYDKAGNADFWRIIGSYNEKPGYKYLAQENELYTHFKAFQEHHVIFCDAQNTAYFENSPLEPQIVLADLIKAFHPELLPGYQPVYYKVLR